MAAMAAISFFWPVISLSQRALKREEVMMGVVPRGERDRRWMTVAMVRVSVYIAMVGGRGTDEWAKIAASITACH